MNRMASAGRILVVDDDLRNIEIVHEALSGSYDVLFATDGLQAIAVARETSPELILMDVVMPGIDGYETCRRLKSDPQTKGIPIIFLTGLLDEAAEVRGLNAGAVDFVTKPLTPAVLQLRVRNQVELHRTRAALERLAQTDGLTGLANRRHFDHALAQACMRCARSGAPLSLALLDVDHFKAYNDHYGHQAGDACLREVATALSSELRRATDVVARYGGEEFAVMLPDLAFVDAEALALRLREAVIARQMPHEASLVGSLVTVSVGVATFEQVSAVTPQDVIRAADELLYRAKAGGRNRVVGCEYVRPVLKCAG